MTFIRKYRNRTAHVAPMTHRLYNKWHVVVTMIVLTGHAPAINARLSGRLNKHSSSDGAMQHRRRVVLDDGYAVAAHRHLGARLHLSEFVTAVAHEPRLRVSIHGPAFRPAPVVTKRSRRTRTCGLEGLPAQVEGRAIDRSLVTLEGYPTMAESQEHFSRKLQQIVEGHRKRQSSLRDPRDVPAPRYPSRPPPPMVMPRRSSNAVGPRSGT